MDAGFWDQRFAREQKIEDFSASQEDALERCLGFFGDVRGKHVLDIGCGLGRYAIAFARRGATVTAVDTSAVATRKLQEFADRNALDITCRCDDVRNIGAFGSFDFVFGAMILHHLEPFDAFASDLRQVMKTGGKGFFYENNAASRLLVWMRQNIVGRLWVPKHGDAEEFPLTPQEVDTLREHFHVQQEFPELVFFRLISTYLLRDRLTPVFSAATASFTSNTF